ncbi:hypothetical protein L0F63_006724 [Massospora cicadina]|nr:hypothetical protein L0F63_006724 [Massospora cicadina]
MRSIRFYASVSKAVRSPRFWGTVALGQFLSLCITATNTTTKLMSDSGLEIPTSQSFMMYLILAVAYTSYAFFNYGAAGHLMVLRERGLYYLVLALVDVEANYFIVKGFANTSFLSAMLINACSAPCVVLLSFLFLKSRYRWTHLLGVAITVAGLGLLVLSDVLAHNDFDTSLSNLNGNPLLGNAYCFVAAFLYAVSNTLEEYCVRKHPKWEILAFLGSFGLIINASQVLILERRELFAYAYVGFTLALVSLYALVPVLIGLTNATFFNISLLSSDFYGLVIGLLAFNSNNHFLYPFAFALVIFGLLFYNLQPVPVPIATGVADPEWGDAELPSPPSKWNCFGVR